MTVTEAKKILDNLPENWEVKLEIKNQKESSGCSQFDDRSYNDAPYNTQYGR